MFIFILYSFIWTDTVNATGEALITIEDWDTGYIQGQQNGAGDYFTWQVYESNGHANEIINVAPYSGPYSYRFQNDGGGQPDTNYLWWNFTEEIDFLYGINLCFDAYYQQNGCTLTESYIYFYNSTDIVFSLYWNCPSWATTGGLYWRDVYGTYHYLYSFYSGFTQRTQWLNITYYKENMFNVSQWVEGVGKYWYNGTAYMGGHGGVVYDGTITKIKFALKPSVNWYSIFCYYFDDVVLNFNPTYIYEPCGDTSSLNYQGKIDSLTPSFYYEPEPYLEIQRDVPFKDVNIKVIDLLFNKYWFENLGDWDEFTLHVNGFNFNKPSCYIEYRGHYLMRWLVDVDLKNEKLLLEFQSLIKGNDPTNPAYYWAVGVSPYDVDNDGDAIFYYHTEHEGPNWGWLDGLRQWITGNSQTYPFTSTDLYNADLLYRVYYSGDDVVVERTYDDSLTLEYKTINTFPATEIIYATTSSLSDPTYIRVEQNGEYLLNYSMTGQADSTWITVLESGRYNVTLYRNGVVKSDYFTVVDNPKNDYIYTNTFETKPTYDFIVYYKYNHSTPCKIKLYDTYDNVVDEWYFEDTPITDHFTYSIDAEGVYKFKLYTYHYNSQTSSADLSQVDECRHIVKNNYVNVLNIYKETITAGLECQLFSGSHNFLGKSVYIRINSETLLYVGDKSEYSTPYCPQYNGEYKADLILKTESGQVVVLDNKTFYVTGGTEKEGGTNNLFNFGNLPPFIKIICALVIIIAMTITPMMLGYFLSRGNISINIPSLVYIAFFFIGVVASIMIGFLDIWVLFVIMFGLVLTFAILWIRKGSEAGGE